MLAAGGRPDPAKWEKEETGGVKKPAQEQAINGKNDLGYCMYILSSIVVTNSTPLLRTVLPKCPAASYRRATGPKKKWRETFLIHGRKFVKDQHDFLLRISFLAKQEITGFSIKQHAPQYCTAVVGRELLDQTPYSVLRTYIRVHTHSVDAEEPNHCAQI